MLQVIINIEIQLKNEHNIKGNSSAYSFGRVSDHDQIIDLECLLKRSMYYLSKMYEEQLGEGEDYSKLDRTVFINILNFKYLKTNKFHTGYRLKEIESNEGSGKPIENGSEC